MKSLNGHCCTNLFTYWPIMYSRIPLDYCMLCQTASLLLLLLLLFIIIIIIIIIYYYYYYYYYLLLLLLLLLLYYTHSLVY